MDDLRVKKYFSPGVNDVIVVKLTGYVDHSNSSQVEKVISEILSTGKIKIIFDFSELVYMSSAGWGVFVGEIKAVREKGGDIKLAAMTPEVYEVYQILEFFHIIDDYSSISDAMKSFGRTPSKEETAPVINKTEVEIEPIDKLLEQSGVKPGPNNKEVKSSVVLIQEKTKPTFIKEEVYQKSDRIKKSTNIRKTLASQPKVSNVNPAMLPLNEKIKRIISESPLLSIFQIRKELQTDKFGSSKVNIYQLYKTLKVLNLESKEKRYRFYRAT